MPEDLKSAVIVLLCKGKREMTECKIYRGISLFGKVGKIYAGILVDKVRSVTMGLIDNEQRVLEQGKGM